MIMMMQEFTERTKYEPSFEEYSFIEEAYYDFNGSKDDFCEQWKKDKESGVWDKELNFRQIIKEMENENKSLKKKIDEMDETIGKQIKEVADQERIIDKQGNAITELNTMLRSARNARSGCYFVMK